ncbi:MAG: hypothetical protein U0793_26000 [Gemmataceae bacterium]
MEARATEVAWPEEPVVYREPDHWRAIRTSGWLTGLFRRQFEKKTLNATPERILNVLKSSRIRCVLIGVVGMAGWRSQPRASGDVDILVARSNFSKAVSRLRGEFRLLRVTRDKGKATFDWRGRFGWDSIIDVFKPSDRLLREAYSDPIVLPNGVRIARLEVALATKYRNATNATREWGDKYQDAADLGDSFRQSEPYVDMGILRKLADVVRPNGGLRLVRFLNHLKKKTGRIKLPS